MVAAAAPSSARRRGLLRAPWAGAAVGSPWPWGSGLMGRASGQAAGPPPAPLFRRPEGLARAHDQREGRPGRADRLELTGPGRSGFGCNSRAGAG